MSKKYTIEDMRAIAHAKGGECLSTEFIDVDTRLLWRCAEGHIFQTSPSTILGGLWCPLDDPAHNGGRRK